MRLLGLLLILAPLVGQAATLSQSTQKQLCTAATQTDAFGLTVEQLLSEGTIQYTDAGAVLSATCGDSFVLSEMVKARQAENLEYAVIDMGVNVDAPILSHQGKNFSVSDYLTKVASNKAADSAKFAANYLQDFHNPAFNPNLLLRRLTMAK